MASGFFAALNLVLLGILLLRGKKNGALGAFPLFFANIGYWLLILLVQFAARFRAGYDSPPYYYVANYTNLALPLLKFAVFWDAGQGRGKRRSRQALRPDSGADLAGLGAFAPLA